MPIYIILLLIVLLPILASLKPYKLPRQIPRVPLWITIYETYFGGSRISFYNKHVRHIAEKHGAVVFWHLGRWTIYLTKPEYLRQLFRDDEAFAKGGSYIRVPWSPLARLFGANIIDTSGHVWKKQRSVIQPGIQRSFDIGYMKQKSSELREKLLCLHEKQGGRKMGIDIHEYVQHWSLSICCKYFMDVELDDLPNLRDELIRNITDQKQGLLGGIVTLFPVLQRVPWLFSTTRRAFRLVDEFERIVLELFGSANSSSNKFNKPTSDNNTVMSLLNDARLSGEMSEFHYRSNLKQILFAGHEEAESVFHSAMLEIARNPQIQRALRSEMSCLIKKETYTLEDLDQVPLLLAVVLETLRLYPPFASLTNRYTTRDVCLGDKFHISAGTWIGWNIYGVQTDPKIWGPDAMVFRPERWGKNIQSIKAMFRAQKAKAVFIPFSTSSRTCLGVKFALMQLRIGLYELISDLDWDVHTESTTTWKKGPVTGAKYSRFTLRPRQTMPMPMPRSEISEKPDFCMGCAQQV